MPQSLQAAALLSNGGVWVLLKLAALKQSQALIHHCLRYSL